MHPLKDSRLNQWLLGGAIGAGLFVGSGSAMYQGGPAALVIYLEQYSLTQTIDYRQVLGYTVVGVMLLMTTLALAEMAVLFPVNGAFYTYIVRFVDPAW